MMPSNMELKMTIDDKQEQPKLPRINNHETDDSSSSITDWLSRYDRGGRQQPSVSTESESGTVPPDTEQITSEPTDANNSQGKPLDNLSDSFPTA